MSGFVDEVVIVAGSETIARHGRIYGRDQFVFDPKHYFAVLEQKPGADVDPAELLADTYYGGFWGAQARWWRMHSAGTPRRRYLTR